jgi:hypothetical protein
MDAMFIQGDVDSLSASLLCFRRIVRWDYCFNSKQKKGDRVMSTHEFDAYCDTQEHFEPSHHEQLLAMHEFEETEKWKPAIAALETLRERLMLFENVYAGQDQELIYVTAALSAYRIAVETLDLELAKYRRWAGLPTQRGGVA